MTDKDIINESLYTWLNEEGEKVQDRTGAIVKRGVAHAAFVSGGLVAGHYINKTLRKYIRPALAKCKGVSGTDKIKCVKKQIQILKAEDKG